MVYVEKEWFMSEKLWVKLKKKKTCGLCKKNVAYVRQSVDYVAICTHTFQPMKSVMVMGCKYRIDYTQEWVMCLYNSQVFGYS